MRRALAPAAALCLVLAWASGATTPGAVAAFDDVALVGVDVHPPSISLENRFAYSQLVFSGRLDNGDTVDLTREALLTSESPHVTLSDRGLVRPAADGDGDLVFDVLGYTVIVPATVSDQAAKYEAQFVRDVMPLLSRIGCTAGGCHGAADGKNGFKLSLRGYDPIADHGALVDDLAGRRFDRVNPEGSLFLLKPTAAVPHEGGQVLRPDSNEYEVLRSWVEGGAQLGSTERVESIEITPHEPSIPQPGMSQQVAVLATYSDGSVRDVTLEAFVEISDIEIGAVEDRGLVTALRRGEAAILARYEGRYAATRMFVMGDRDGYRWVETPEHNYVDELVHRKLQRIKAVPSELCTDAEFLRRVYLDLAGKTPSPKEIRTFLMDSRDTRVKRDEVIDRLIGSADFVDHWTTKWADLLQVHSNTLGVDGARAFRDWIRGQVASNAPYDGFVRAVLNSSGSTYQNPPSAYYKVLREPDVVMENTTQLFLGVRFNCNKCHDHPFERWTQDQHWELAAYFGQVGRKNAEGSPLMPAAVGVDRGRPAFEEIVSDLQQGEVEDPDTGIVVPPAFPYEHDGALPAEGTRRAKLASWITASENPYFAKSFVNRVWSYFLGVGLIDPVDDIRAGNPPSNPELLDRLTSEFVTSGFDVREIMRTICRSRTYQLSIRTNEWNADDGINYSHALARRLPAEVLYDALHRATGSVSRLPGVRPGTLATELLDSTTEASDGFLDLFGRPPRGSSCECERSSSMSLRQALSLVNGPTVADAIRDPENRIAELVAYERRTENVIDELYLTFLCRLPTDDERSRIAPTFTVGDPENRAALSPADDAELTRRITEWESSIVAPDWRPTVLATAHSTGGASIVATDDGALRVEGTLPEKDTYTLVVATDLPALTGIRIEALPDPSLPAKGPGRAENGNFVLHELSVTAVPADDPRGAKEVVLRNATADFSQGGWPVAAAIDKKPDTGWAIVPQTGRRHVAVFETAEDVGAEGGSVLVLTLDQQLGTKHTLGHFRISVTSSPRPVRHHGLPDAVARALAVPPADRTSEEAARVYAHYLSTDREMSDRIRLGAAQDLAWALTNSPAFLFNR